MVLLLKFGWKPQNFDTTILLYINLRGDILSKYKEENFKGKTFKLFKSKSKTITEIMYEWLEISRNNIKISTYQKYKSTIERHIIPKIGELEPKDLSAVIIQKYTDWLLSENFSRTTINDILVVLGMGMNYCEKEYGIVIHKIKLLKTQKKEMRVLSITEQNRFVAFLLQKNDVFSFGMLLALFTGLRIGELCALTWEDIGEKTINVNKTIQRINKNGHTEILLLPPKTLSSNRIIPIPKEIALLLQTQRGRGLVLKQENGKQIEPRLMQLKFKKYTAECGIENINFHSLRHSFATRCVEIGFDIKTLSEILGHKDVKTTLNKYVHSSMEQKIRQMDLLKFNIAI